MTPAQYGAAFARFSWLILLLTALGVGLATARDQGVPTDYTSTARVSVGPTAMQADNATDKYYASIRATQAQSLATSKMPAYAALADDPTLVTRMQEDGAGDVAKLRDHIKVSPIENTATMTVTATGTNPDQVQQLASQAAKSLAGLITDMEQQRRGETLLTAKVVGKTTAATAVNDAPRWRNPLIGAVAGLFLGLALAVGLTRLDRKVRDEKTLTELLGGVPVLGDVPRISGRRRSTSSHVDAVEAVDAFRTNVYFLRRNHDRGLRIALTSTPATPGMAGLSAALADSLADTGARVLLVDADLREDADRVPGSPSAGGPGLSQLGSDDIARSISSSPDHSYDILPSGGAAAEAEADALLHRDAFADLLDRAAVEYDYVVIRSAPVANSTGARAAAARCDATVLAVPRRGISRKALLKAGEELHLVEARLVGVVLVS